MPTPGDGLKMSVLVLLVLTLIVSLPLAVELVTHRDQDEKAKVERARFMLECVADWQYAPATCETILEGAPPPVKPDAMGEPGC